MSSPDASSSVITDIVILSRSSADDCDANDPFSLVASLHRVVDRGDHDVPWLVHSEDMFNCGDSVNCTPSDSMNNVEICIPLGFNAISLG
jgi:hypothetical protein